MKCDLCKTGEMSQKKGPHGSFLGCSNYPECKRTMKIESVLKETPKTSEYHLTPEQCRSNALDTAIEWLRLNNQTKFNASEVIATAKIFAAYIFEGK